MLLLSEVPKFSNIIPVRINYTGYDKTVCKTAIIKAISATIKKEAKLHPSLETAIDKLISWVYNESTLEVETTKSLMFSGNTGSGKTVLMDVLNQLIKYDNIKYVNNGAINTMYFTIVSAKDIFDVYTSLGIKGLDTFVDQKLNICIDDMGSETIEATNYGTRICPVGHVIERRYNNGKFTNITTNLKMSRIKELYGDRIYSRLSEMCNNIEIAGLDFRTTK